MKNLFGIIILLGLVCCKKRPDNEDSLKKYLLEYSQNNSDSLSNYLSENIEVYMDDEILQSGKDYIESTAIQRQKFNIKILITNIEKITNEKYIVRGKSYNWFYNCMGGEKEIKFTTVYEMKNGKIVKIFEKVVNDVGFLRVDSIFSIKMNEFKYWIEKRGIELEYEIDNKFVPENNLFSSDEQIKYLEIFCKEGR